ncbi:MAG: class I SAM-dependent methyltransferase [Candidatus Tectomicrobia bacterium]|uniref:Class I SAM-dependent methyltransferase n=1 Tax=Tectimicrobiota bacterium TaxID=2528274 RepID=A0A938B1F3_UNCTE|nr:class I SAM-dependent methyltransferase [Candidatus Tectomicrobia bacterium]
MPIDFHAEANRYTYTTRTADESWQQAILALVMPQGKRVVDIGCGGGIYSHAWVQLGATSVCGVDFSEQMILAARAHLSGVPQVTFQQGNARSTGLPDGCADIVFARALLHHITELSACVDEAYRLLVPGGCYIIQDRTVEDVQLAGSPEHIRGYFFACFPRLLSVEAARRPQAAALQAALRAAGLTPIPPRTLWEIRQTYPHATALAEDLRQRTGRSILHELTDDELATLVAHIVTQLPADTPVVEQDRWTLWCGVR